MISICSDGTTISYRIKRTLIKNGRVVPGLAGFIPKGDGITKCVICGKRLPDSLSAARTIGPECIKKYGPMPGYEWVEGHVKEFKKYQRRMKKEGKPVMDFNKWITDRELNGGKLKCKRRY
jgi:hypothetical protein